MIIANLLLAALAVAPSPESQGVSSRSLEAWIEACERELDAVHGFVLVRHGKVVAEGSWAPYDTLNETHRLYSHSKSFTSTAVGFLVDDGKLDLDERVIDILPDKAPAVPSDNLKALRVRDLLTMNVGASETDAERNDPDGDWERAFLANEIDVRPGQRFKYDSGATYLLSAIVGRKAGRPMMELLKERLFDRIGIASAWSTTSPGGTPCGGWGMNMTTRELALFGQLYLNRGVWNGERILSDEWVTLATARQTWSGPIGITGEDGSDWHQGYGFQFWRCRHGCYRADGAGGQYTIVFPAHDAVLSIHSGLGDMQKELDLVWRHILPAFSPAPLPEDASAAESLRTRCAKLALPCVRGAREGADRLCGVDFRMTNTVQSVSEIRLDRTDSGWTLSLTTDAGVQSVPVGFHEWARGKVRFSNRAHEGLGDITGEQRVASSAAVAADGTLKVRMLLLDGPQKLDLSFAHADGVPSVSGYLHGICGGGLSGSVGAPSVGHSEGLLDVHVREKPAETLAEAVAKDLERPVRPGGVEGRPFWNRYSVQFMYPPAFEFAAVKGAAKYRFTVVDDVLNEHVFEADRPTADLSPVWKGVPVGFARVTVDGLGADGAVCGRAGTRRFWKAAAFEPPRAWGYGEAARRYYGYLFEQPNTVHFREKGTPDEEGFLDLPVVYPSKMNSALIQAMLRYAKVCPERRDAAILTARKVADYMLSISQPADAPLANFPPTYRKKANQHLSFASVKYAGQNMLIYPAWMGDAYLDLHEVTGERKYLDAALAIAATFERIQRPNGSWYVKVWEKDGQPVIEGENTEPYYIIPTDIYFFFTHLAAKTCDSRWTKVADRAFGYLEKGPMTTYDWAAQYEDTPPTKDYIGHSGDMAADAALILLDRYPADPARIEQARELMRWVEDQFVFWTRPCRGDKRGILSEKSEAFSPVWDGSHPKYSFDNWLDVPSSTEKYGYTNPINSKTAKVMRLFLKMYRRTGDRLCLEKAKALGDGIVRVQAMVGTGNIPTHFWKTDCRGDRGENDWTNCGTFTALGLEELADELERGGN